MKKLKAIFTSVPAASVVFGAALALTLGLSAMQPVVAQNNIEGGIGAGALSAKSNEQPDNIDGDNGMFKRITDVLLFIVGAVAVIMLIVGGIRYVTSGGNQQAVSDAKNTILYAIVGIIVVLLAYAVVNFVVSQFRVQ
ncbi:MAG: pilin [Candidatus Saccharibacteria bacterium]|nr:pilin [Candidatus Saccharibacteria bacterium]